MSHQSRHRELADVQEVVHVPLDLHTHQHKGLRLTGGSAQVLTLPAAPGFIVAYQVEEHLIQQ